MRNCRSCDFLIKDPEQTSCAVCGFDEYSPWGHAADDRLTNDPSTETQTRTAPVMELEHEVRVAPAPRWIIAAYVLMIASIVVPFTLMALDRYESTDVTAPSAVEQTDTEPVVQLSVEEQQQRAQTARLGIWAALGVAGLVMLPLSNAIFGEPKAATISDRKKMR